MAEDIKQWQIQNFLEGLESKKLFLQFFGPSGIEAGYYNVDSQVNAHR